MFAIAFDLAIRSVKQHHPRSVSQGYRDIGRVLRAKGFERAQGSVYLTDRNDLANLFGAVRDLENLSWFPKCVRDIRGFRVEDWSDFTALITEKAEETRQAAATAGKGRTKRSGFREDAAQYASSPPDLVGQFRRLGDDGPAYEVIDLAGGDEALIEVVYSSERVTIPIADIMNDPIAETIP